jgi:hypothetical protein
MDTKPYLTFASAEPFSMKSGRSIKWDGTVEWSTDTSTWSAFGSSAKSSAEHEGEQRIYLRGTGNTVVSGGNAFTITGSNVRCIGNIETLLDYETAQNGGHPVMGAKCFGSLFSGCTGLITAPELPATTLTDSCYASMFKNTGLITAPELPAVELTTACYQSMFSGCTGIKLSAVQTDECWKEYRIPTTGEGQTVDGSASTLMSAIYGMFDGTGGTFTGTPEINTVYYIAAPKDEPAVPEMSRGQLYLLYRMFSPVVFYALTGKRHWME